jgi:type IV pilus assembly protein PilE
MQTFVTTASTTPQRRRALRAAQDLARRQRGFTLLELMITLVIMALILAVAFPSYMSTVRKSRRAEAIGALTAVQQAQERFRANRAIYGNLNVPADADTLPNIAATTVNGHYTLTVTGNAAAAYTVVATAAGSQANDTACAVMGVRSTGGNLRYGSGSTSINWAAAEPDSGNCWAK